MAVITKFNDNGKPIYMSSKGVGSTDAEREKADKLDTTIKTSIAEFINSIKNSSQNHIELRGNVEIYWEFGYILREIFFKSKLIENKEKHLFWLNVKIHSPDELIAKDRGPNRQHIEYCFRLAGFSKEKATMMKWGEWVYLFDSPGINREPRFDEWFDKKIDTEPSRLERNDIRLFVQIINFFLKGIETSDLSNQQLVNIYDASWKIKEKFINSNLKNSEIRDRLSNYLKENFNQLSLMIDGQISINDFVNSIQLF